jgi:hypothetical protein
MTTNMLDFMTMTIKFYIKSDFAKHPFLYIPTLMTIHNYFTIGYICKIQFFLVTMAIHINLIRAIKISFVT